jgi:RHS repeat-associated protein
MRLGTRTAWSRNSKTAVRYLAAVTLAAGTALFAYQLPAQAQSGATDPDVGTPVSTSPVTGSSVNLNDEGLATDSGKISVPSAGGSGGSSATGDWSATDLANAGSWSQGGSTGAFTYSYGIELPPAEGPVPSVGLSYSSQAVDGHTSSSNNQAGVIGDGWSYTPGYIERTYTGCMSDEDGGNTPEATADRCWEGKSPSVTMVLEGVNASLVFDDDTDKWVSSADPGWKVELLGAPASSSEATTERWQITTTSGTVYTFGARATGSRLTVPVFGNHSGEACYKADDFAGSECAQAYRWMLDEVTDVHGNRARFEWQSETGHYGAAVDEDNRSAFHRSARLTRIDYGLRSDDTAVQAGRVSFTYTDRCESDCYNADSTPKEDSWPETPWDQECATAPCTDLWSPAFFSSKRLSEIATYVPNGSGGFTKVDSWALTQEFLDYGDGEDTVLWLKSIQRTGHVGGTASTPPVTFSGIAFPNRVEHSEGTPSMWRTRLTSITSETGAVTGVWYSAPSCTWDALPNKLGNSSLCYPVLSEEGETEEWFHKYVVTQVAQFDTTAGQLPLRTYYEYSTAGGDTTRLWGWDDSEFTDDELRTFNQWRGYAQVTTRSGDPLEGPQLTGRTRYYRGMDGQPTTATGTGSLEVALTDSEGEIVVDDHEALAGAVFETNSFDGSDVIGATVSQYWTSLAAERTYEGGSIKAWLTGQSQSDSRELLDTVTDTWRRTQTQISYDARGRATDVSDLGEAAVDNDQKCARIWYADNAAVNRFDLVARTETIAVDCGVDETDIVYPDDLISETRFFYDGDTADTDVAPTEGLLTSTQQRKTYAGTAADWVETMSATYDDLGRLLTSEDALNRTTKASYTPAGGGPVSSVSTSNPLGHLTTVYSDGTRGLPVKTVDANSRVTETVYDPLGRTLAVWGPGWAKETHADVPSAAFEYSMSNTEPSAVTSYSLSPSGTKRLDGVVLYDSLLREVQAQAPTAQGGRLLTLTEYDTRGLTRWKSGPNWDSLNEPGTDLVSVQQGEDQARTFYTYDGAGRVVLEEFMSHQEILLATETVYGGSTAGWMVSVNPPEGATPTAAITNAQGELIEKRDFHGDTATGDQYDATAYEYDHRGNLAKVTDEADNEWSYDYDLWGRQISATDPDTGTTTAVYDDAGQLIQTVDNRNRKLTTTYDDLGRRYNLYDGETTGTRINAWRYDSVSGGKGLPYQSASFVDGKTVMTRVNSYDAAGRPTSVTQVIPDGIAGFTGVKGSYNVEQYYSPDGSVAVTNLPQVSGLPSESVVYQYNDLGQVTRLYGDVDGSTESVDYVSEATYTAFGELAQRVLGENSGEKVYQTWTYEDGTRRLDQHLLTRDSVSSPVVADLDYEYDEAGNITSIADSVTDSPGDPERQCFVYDYLQRLTEAWAQAGTGSCASESDLDSTDIGGPGAYWTSYAYDVTGNRTSVTDHTANTTAEYDYTAAHLVDTVTTGSTANSYEWDAAGNLAERTIGGVKETLTWNAAGKLASIASPSGTTRMIYDGENNRIGRIDADGTQNLFVGGQEIVVDPQGVVHATRTYAHNGEMVATRSTDTGLTWIGNTHQGTAAWAMSAATLILTYRRQDPFGNPRGATANWTATQQSYHTGIEDPTGLVSMGARFYDPTTGRFISRDPIQAFTDAQQINGYSYANNNPVNMSDPTGLWSCIDGDCSYHNNDGSLKSPEECEKTGCGTGQCSIRSCGSPQGDSNAPEEGGDDGSALTFDDGRIVLNEIDITNLVNLDEDALALRDYIDEIMAEFEISGYWGASWALRYFCDNYQEAEDYRCGIWSAEGNNIMANAAACELFNAGCDFSASFEDPDLTYQDIVDQKNEELNPSSNTPPTPGENALGTLVKIGAFLAPYGACLMGGAMCIVGNMVGGVLMGPGACALQGGDAYCMFETALLSGLFGVMGMAIQMNSSPTSMGGSLIYPTKPGR